MTWRSRTTPVSRKRFTLFGVMPATYFILPER
jgi:hypothetical protein